MVMKPTGHLLWIYAGASLAAVSLGCVVCAASHLPAGLWGRNLVAWVIGLCAALSLTTMRGQRSTMIVGVAAALLFASLFGPPQDGVRRWLMLGPVTVNVAFVVLAPALVALATLRRPVFGLTAALFMLVLLVVQPDASQATAFAAGVGVIASRRALSWPVRLAILALIVGLTAIAWMRPDPLLPVQEVEEILRLAQTLSPALAVLGVLLFAAAALAPVAASLRAANDARTAGFALGAYMVTTAAMTTAGAFPMPLIGVGMSPILGFWLGVGLLAGGSETADRP